MPEPNVLELSPGRDERAREHSSLWQQVRAGTALLSMLALLWLGLVSLTFSPAAGRAAGQGGAGRFGSGGDGTGFGGSEDRGAQGTSSDPVATAGNADSLASSSREQAVADGSVTAVESGRSQTDQNQKRGELDFRLAELPEAASGSGNPPPGRGAGSGSDGAQFFGVRSAGKKFIYVVDRSGSMSGEPLERAKAELARSIGELNAGQLMYVIFFDDQPLCQFDESGPPSQLSRAVPNERRKLLAWVDQVGEGGGTNPRLAMQWALHLKPDAIYLLSDGQFDATIVTELTAQNSTARIPIHTIAFINRVGESLLKDLASQNQGTYRFQP